MTPIDQRHETWDGSERRAEMTENTNAELRYIRLQLDDIKARLDNKYVTLEAFEPVRKLVYGFIAVACSAIVLALMALVIRKP